jgi:amino-acid N-acetyltransferase
MTGGIIIRRAAPEDACAIARLIETFAAEALMLQRTPAMIELAVADYVVGERATGEIVACGALKEYSPSVAEVSAIAVSPELQGYGVGRAIVDSVERLAVKRGTYDLFALTLQPKFFAALGYQPVERARFPEKIRRDCLGCARRFACSELCFAKPLNAAVRSAA